MTAINIFLTIFFIIVICDLLYIIYVYITIIIPEERKKDVSTRTTESNKNRIRKHR